MFEVDVKKRDGEGEGRRGGGPAQVWGSDAEPKTKHGFKNAQCIASRLPYS